MSYQVLARKWRPRTFASLVGQEHVVRALTHALQQQRLHHAYLFTGTRGVGKTTIARILAKSLNCETGITATPCGTCSACTEIDAGRFIDLLEVDAATNTRVDEMRQLLENAVYAPTRGRFKVYVIDEVHMLSNSAFNAMLKTLEEPPEHIKFILATTDPQKIPVTVLSRCLQFSLKQMPQAAIAQHLARIAGEESIEADPQALALLAQAARGSMRDALSLLDQAIAFAAGKVGEADVRAMLGTVDQSYLFGLLERLVENDIAGMLAIASDMDSRSVAFDGALQELGALLHRIALVSADADALPAEAPNRDRIVALADRLDAELVQLLYQIVIHGRQDLPLAPDEYAGFTMTLLRMAVFRTDADGAPGASGDAGAERSGSQRPAARASTAGERPAARPVQGVAAATRPEPLRERPLPNVVRSPAPVAQPAARAASVAPQSEDTSSNVSLPFDGDWPALARSLRIGGIVKQLAEHCALASFSGNVFELRVPTSAKHLVERSFQDKLRAAIEERLGGTVRLSIEIGEASGATVAAQDQARRDAERRRAEATIQQDPFVRDLVSQFGATIDAVKPAPGPASS